MGLSSNGSFIGLKSATAAALALALTRGLCKIYTYVL